MRHRIAIRLASAADVPALAELRRVPTSELHPGHADEDFGDRFAAWGYLANAYVRPAYRNQGIGTRLAEAVLSYADAHGFARIVLSPSQRSIPFYRRAGFGPADALLLREHSAG